VLSGTPLKLSQPMSSSLVAKMKIATPYRHLKMTINPFRQWFECPKAMQRVCREICETHCRTSKKKQKECPEWQTTMEEKTKGMS
jgi:hypothetical protein